MMLRSSLSGDSLTLSPSRKRHCDPAIAEAVNTIIYAAPRADQVKELSHVRDQLIAKFGKEFVINAMENRENCVNPRIISKLAISTPDPLLVDRYLEEIARTYSVEWQAGEGDDGDDNGDGGGLQELIDVGFWAFVSSSS